MVALPGTRDILRFYNARLYIASNPASQISGLGVCGTGDAPGNFVGVQFEAASFGVNDSGRAADANELPVMY